MQGGGPGELGLFRLFGDATRDGVVNSNDTNVVSTAMGSSSTSPNYRAYLDANNDGNVDQIDLGQFRARLNTSLWP
jgi:hypothetical protein